jgi:hypothetical protein
LSFSIAEPIQRFKIWLVAAVDGHLISEAGATFKSLADGWADTTTPHCKLMLTVLGGIAEFERSLIMRTNEGRAKAKAEGIVFGRKQADHASAPRGVEAARRWRDDARHRDDLQRLPHHDCAAQASRPRRLINEGRGLFCWA